MISMWWQVCWENKSPSVSGGYHVILRERSVSWENKSMSLSGGSRLFTWTQCWSIFTLRSRKLTWYLRGDKFVGKIKVCPCQLDIMSVYVNAVFAKYTNILWHQPYHNFCNNISYPDVFAFNKYSIVFLSIWFLSFEPIPKYKSCVYTMNCLVSIPMITNPNEAVQ